jgi:hypothetical protein
MRNHGGAHILSSQQDGQSRPARDTAEDTAEDIPDPGSGDDVSVARAAEASANAAKVIADIDDLVDDVHESLIAMLFEPGEVVTPEEFELRAATMNSQFIQKGGQ